MTQPITNVPTPDDIARTPEAASGRVDWSYTFDGVVSDSGQAIPLPYLAPSFGEMRRLGNLAVMEQFDQIAAIASFLTRRVGQEMADVTIEYMDTTLFQQYIQFCSGAHGGKVGKGQS